jgi:hypothetical protein
MIGIDFFADFMVMGLRDYLISPFLNNLHAMPVANSNNPMGINNLICVQHHNDRDNF